MKELLLEKEITGKELSENLGVSQNTISNIVNGHSFPKPKLLIEIAKSLDVDIKDLFISTKETNITDPTIALKEIKKITDKALLR